MNDENKRKAERDALNSSKAIIKANFARMDLLHEILIENLRDRETQLDNQQIQLDDLQKQLDNSA